MAIPAWANEELSKLLPQIRKAGEGQNAEFKEEFPDQGHSLGTEVAAFATASGGWILLGVHNNGDVAGLDCDSEAKRDALLHRAQNLIATIQPPVNYQLALGYDGGAVLGIIVAENQKEPVYYYQFRPYLRDNRTSRPAGPEEVKELVWSHSSSEHQRKMEELNYRIANDHHETMAKATADQHAVLEDLRRSVLR
jgi:ATP-dependent DNA helicase RecG